MLERPPDPRRVHLPRNAHDDDYAAAGNFHLPHLKGETPDNTSIDSGGIYVYNFHNDGAGNADYTPGYFVRITGNTVLGVSRRDNFGGIGLNTGRFGTVTYTGVQAYANEITNNIITGYNFLTTGSSLTEAGPFSGIYDIGYGFSNASNGAGTGDSTNIIIAGNCLSNLKAGITLTKSDYGQVVINNRYDSKVLNFLVNSNSIVINNTNYGQSDNTLVIGNTLTSFVTAQNLALQGTITAAVTSPTGTGNHNIAIIRDGVRPTTNRTNPLQQYDTNNGNAGPAIQYYGYTFSSSQVFKELVFAEGLHNTDGGWFANGTLKVQVRQSGVWVDAVLTSYPAYPNGDTPATFGAAFQTYDFALNNVVGDGIRIYGTAGGTNRYVSISELEVWGNPGTVPLARVGPPGLASAAQPSLAPSTSSVLNVAPSQVGSPDTTLLVRSSALSLVSPVGTESETPAKKRPLIGVRPLGKAGMPQALVTLPSPVRLSEV